MVVFFVASRRQKEHFSGESCMGKVMYVSVCYNYVDRTWFLITVPSPLPPPLIHVFLLESVINQLAEGEQTNIRDEIAGRALYREVWAATIPLCSKGRKHGEKML